MNCTECEHYKKYDGPKLTKSGKKAVMFCPKLAELDGCDGYHYDTRLCGNKDYFTPKKPPAEKVEEDCNNCGRNRLKGDNSCDLPKCDSDYSGWIPIPEKPKEPEVVVEKNHRNCKHGKKGGGVEPCKTCMEALIDEKTGIHNSLWEPEEPEASATKPEKTKEPEKKCYNCGISHQSGNGTCDKNTKCDDKYSGWQPIKKPSQQTINPPKKKEAEMAEITCVSCAYYCKHEGDKIDKRSGIQAIMCCVVEEDRYLYFSDTEPCDDYEKDQPVKEIKSKEIKMSTLNKIFYPIRRYVAGCAIYCTAKICIFLNPKIFWLAGLIRPDYAAQKGEYRNVFDATSGEYLGKEVVENAIPWNSGDPKQIAFVWLMVALAFVGVLVALWAYNQFCKKLFGEK